MTLTGISLSVVAFGVLLLLLGLILVLRRNKSAGIIIALLGFAMIAVPILVYVYALIAMR